MTTEYLPHLIQLAQVGGELARRGVTRFRIGRHGLGQDPP